MKYFISKILCDEIIEKIKEQKDKIINHQKEKLSRGGQLKNLIERVLSTKTGTPKKKMIDCRCRTMTNILK